MLFWLFRLSHRSKHRSPQSSSLYQSVLNPQGIVEPLLLHSLRHTAPTRMHEDFMISQSSTSADDLLQQLGEVSGVSELAFNANKYRLNAPVLLAENAFVFFAWQSDAEQNQLV